MGDVDLTHLLPCLEDIDIPKNRFAVPVIKALTERREILTVQNNARTLEDIVSKQQKNLGEMASALNKLN